ncbi:hypothetical protein KIPB_002757 [Kipferlia bialata]|uniref:Lipid-binding serum glycoprotein C-terminal domain-containing protein n=1 Tax=Kipferlia bialata TaxID=797122 RepID=A0A9K3GGG8_9EUKA|nr:hypothetical protein KIPB_002757 [Kipferlia bialata]|eukprot:g2757.t1
MFHMTSHVMLHVMLLLLVAGGWAQTGVEYVLTQEGVNQIIDVVWPDVDALITTVIIPDCTVEVDSPLGTLDITLSQVTIKSLDITPEHIVASFVEGVGMNGGASEVGATFALNWAWEMQNWPYTSDSGTADASAEDASIQGTFALGMDQYRPHIECTDMSTDLGDVQIEINGSSYAWFYNIFADIFMSTLEKDAEAAIDMVVSTVLMDELNTAFLETDTDIPIDDSVDLDMRMMSPPSIGSTYLSEAYSGMVHSPMYDIEMPGFDPSPLPLVIDSSPIQLVCDAMLFDSLYYTYYMEDMFQGVTKDTNSGEAHDFLNTNAWMDQVPALYDYCPGCNMRVRTNTTDVPTVSMAPGAMLVSSSMLMAVDVESVSASEWVEAFTLSVDAVFSVDVSVQVTNITLTHTPYTFDAAMEDNHVDGLTSDDLEWPLVVFLYEGVTPFLNSWSDQHNFAIVEIYPGVAITDPHTFYSDTYVMVGGGIGRMEMMEQ